MFYMGLETQDKQYTDYSYQDLYCLSFYNTPSDKNGDSNMNTVNSKTTIIVERRR